MIQKTNQKSFQFYKKNFYQIIYIYMLNMNLVVKIVWFKCIRIIDFYYIWENILKKAIFFKFSKKEGVL